MNAVNTFDVISQCITIPMTSSLTKMKPPSSCVSSSNVTKQPAGIIDFRFAG